MVEALREILKGKTISDVISVGAEGEVRIVFTDSHVPEEDAHPDYIEIQKDEGCSSNGIKFMWGSRGFERIVHRMNFKY
ncbi:MAG: hypothetical protein COW88_03425 [Candidatus Lloydbacteria bacterium CG22_combo_CG10-13_8_21_14_all_47_15]|uniref:Uncharacterized protein n=1 Tax=Candidatus Lloydbacteria bacterium CG22_combo_CG10-13_8_21_14_all_47_15 TaxID=1974635 RepID=A0A2H0CT49_9BACT|nr:MAG: hypothetical protein COW88_03425 [Candidatus Lloydbacteria bacterium CG22_combo_CG10-13_8_21_14_all_47_15]